MKKKAEPVIPERPACQSCGAPASYAFRFDMNELELSKDYRDGNGLRWSMSYDGGTTVSGNLCATCAGNRVKIDVTATMNVDGKESY